MRCTSVFERNLNAYVGGEKLIINQGGTRSSKTYSLLQLLFLIALKSEKPLVISVVSQSLPHLKLGAMRDFDAILQDAGYIPSELKNISNSTYTINNSIIEFFSTSDAGKCHGPARDILMVNEAQYVKHKSFEQLSIRTRGTIFIDFNPTKPFWVHDDIILNPETEHTLIKSTYLDNEYLTESQIKLIESKKNNKYWWECYGKGELSRLEGAIFQNWEYGEYQSLDQECVGLDFGSTHPTASTLISVDKVNMKIYAKELIYETGLSTNMMINLLKARVPNNKLIIADSAAPLTITDIGNAGLNIQPVVKNKVVEDIKTLLDYQIIVDPSSKYLATELSTWQWKDSKSELPEDEGDDLCDSLRYGSMYLINPPKKKGVTLARRRR